MGVPGAIGTGGWLGIGCGRPGHLHEPPAGVDSPPGGQAAMAESGQAVALAELEFFLVELKSTNRAPGLEQREGLVEEGAEAAGRKCSRHTSCAVGDRVAARQARRLSYVLVQLAAKIDARLQPIERHVAGKS